MATTLAEKARRCEQCGTENPLGARFCMECGVRLASDDKETGPGERRTVTVVFADLSGFTNFSEQADPEEVRALAQRAAVRLEAIVRRHGGTVDKVIGDCVMALFGAPVSHEDDAARAVRASLEMLADVVSDSEAYAGLALRVGVNTGDVIFASVGRSGQYTVLGDTVNTASRLQSAAARNTIYVGARTHEATAELFDYEQVPPVTAKGKAEPVPAWRPLQPAGVVVEPARRSPLVGRRRELGRLEELLDRVMADGRPQTVTVVGPPGIGKSRLLFEFVRQCSADVVVHWGHCRPYGEGITYAPVAEIVKGAAAITDDDPADQVARKLDLVLTELGTGMDLDELRTVGTAVSNLLAVPTTPRGTYGAANLSQAELHWGLRQFFAMLAAARPRVLVFEDLHWAEPTLLEFLGYASTGSGPHLLLLSGRPELLDRDDQVLVSAANRRVVRLGTLDQEDSAHLVANLLAADVDDERVRQVVETADGNPLYAEEFARALSEGSLTGVPKSLEALIGTRLDQLSTNDRDVARCASVMGTVFWPEAVVALDPDRPPDRVATGLTELERHDFVHASTTTSIEAMQEYAFKHVLVRDVAYGRLPKARRVVLHERAARWIASLPGPDKYVEIVAWHFEQACLRAQEVARSGARPPLVEAVQALTSAAERAESREGLREAAGFYSRALRIVGNRLPETRTELRFRHAAALRALGRYDEALPELDSVIDDAAGLGRDDLNCRALFEAASGDWVVESVKRARERVDSGVALAKTMQDRVLQVRGDFLLADLQAHCEGAFEESVERVREALVLCSQVNDRPLETEGQLRLGMLLYNLGRLAEANEAMRRCAQLAREEGSLRNEARSTYGIAGIGFYLGKRDAEQLCRKAVRWLERTGDQYIQVQALGALAKMLLARGDPAGALESLERAVPIAADLGGWSLTDVQRALTQVLVSLGRIDEARVAAKAAQRSAPGEDTYAVFAATIAEALTVQSAKDAMKGFEAALDTLASQCSPIDLADARLCYAETMRRLGDVTEGRRQFVAAREEFEAMGADALVSRIDDALSEIGQEFGHDISQTEPV